MTSGWRRGAQRYPAHGCSPDARATTARIAPRQTPGATASPQPAKGPSPAARTKLFGRAHARHRLRCVGLPDHPRSVLRHTDLRGVPLGARHSAGDADRRLRKLTQLAIFRQVATACRQRKEYRLTKMGFDLYPSFIALMQFGDRWLSGGKPPPLTLVHTAVRLRQPSDRRVLAMRRTRSARRFNTATDRAPAANPPRPAATPGAPPTAAGSCWAVRVRFRARWRSSATNGASWSSARVSSAIAATTRS